MRKEIENFPNYFIEDNGKIWSEKTKQYLNPSINENGYAYITLRDNNKKSTLFLIHRLVGLYFLPNPNNFSEINHKDENKLNNNINNLEWCDRQYNINYGTRLSKIRKKVICVETNIIYESISNAAKQTGINRGHINSVCLNKRQTAGGYHWKYIN